MENMTLEVNEHLNNDVNSNELILIKRKIICDKIFNIEMRYKTASDEEKIRLNKELRKCGNKLIKLLPHRKTVQSLYEYKYK